MADSIYEQRFDPVKQAAIALAGVLVFNLVAKALQLGGAVEGNRFPWMTAASFMLLFALFNSVFSVATDNMMKYWGRSLYSFMGLAVIAGLLAWAFSGLTISEAGSYRWIYIVVTIGYLVFLAMMAFMRQVVDFAQKEEWNAPNIRKRKEK